MVILHFLPSQLRLPQPRLPVTAKSPPKKEEGHEQGIDWSQDLVLQLTEEGENSSKES